MVLRRLLILALALAPLAAAAPQGGTERAFVAVEDADELVAVDLNAPPAGLDGARVVARLRVPNGPHNVAVTRDRRFVLVTSPPAGAVTLVDAYSARVVHAFRGMGSPHDVEVSWDGRYAYVTDERRAQVVVLDLRARRIVRRIAVRPGPHDLAVRPDGKRVWVTHGPRERVITILDTSKPARAGVLAVTGAAGAHDIAFESGLWVWVTYWDSGIVGKIRAYDRMGRSRLQQYVGELVHHLQVDVGGRVWATDHHTGDVFLLSRRSGRPVLGLGGCPGAHHVDVGPGRGIVAAACHDAGTLLVYDPVARTSRSIRVGPGPHGVAIAWVP